jgi:hypothetical protein
MRFRMGRALVACAACCVGIAILFVATHRRAEAVSPQAGAAELARVRARFVGQAPLIDMAARHTTTSSPGRSNGPLHSLHALVLDTRRGTRLVHVYAPYWYSRLMAGRGGVFRWLGELTWFDDTEFDAEPIGLSLREVVAHGPGILVDLQHDSGGQFLAWAE